MLADVVAFLRCPHCEAAVALVGPVLRCAGGHSFDVARQGYVNLIRGETAGTADTAAMVTDRGSFLARGHFGPLQSAVVDAVRAVAPVGLVVDAGAGTGSYVAAALDAAPAAVGLAVDVSVPAARRAARAHPRVGAVVADVWGSLPVGTGVADLVLNVFAPRNAAEFRRTLAPGGALVVATPTPEHLVELRERLGLLSVDGRKDDRLQASVGEVFALAERTPVAATMSLTREDARALVGMGPSARHIEEAELLRRVEDLPERTAVTLSVLVSTYRPL